MSASAAPADTDGTDPIGGAVARLAADGFAVVDGLLPVDLPKRLMARLRALDTDGALATAAVGRDKGRQIDGAVRRAAIRWLDGDDAAERDLLDFAEVMRIAINRSLFLGLFRFECNFIAYPVGGFYRRHLDSLVGARNRIVSFVTYLDDDWREADGGALRVWRHADDEGEPALEIVPRAGRVVLMLSEQIPHEVVPALRPRHAIAGWWRVAAD